MMGELTASLAHEINQPICAALIDAKTSLRWLKRVHPDLKKACEAVLRVVKDVTRAAEVIVRVRLLFEKGSPRRELVDVNEAIRALTVLLGSEATRYAISIRTVLAADPPHIMADRVQLQQVLMNLMINGIDAMKSVDGTRELIIQSRREVAAGRRQPTSGVGQRYRCGASPAAGRPDLKGVFYHQKPRHWYGASDQPNHC
jgi:C4-dicarboxylate-specific signal transduction histidine kinase